MTETGVAHDPKAREFFRELYPEQHDVQETLNPHIVFVTPEGESLGELHGYSHPDTAVARLLGLIESHPDLTRPRPDELDGQSPVERAEVLIDLMRLDEVDAALEGVDSDRARYLRAHAARLRGDDAALAEHLSALAGTELEPDAKLEAAWGLFRRRDFPALQRQVTGFPATHPRHDEALYLEGLAMYHQGRKQKAREHWESMIGSCALSPWVYRADWAYYCTTFEITRKDDDAEERHMDSFGAFTPLNRHGYGYRQHPDLKLDTHAPFDAREGEAPPEHY
jgi:hypothetical protein